MTTKFAQDCVVSAQERIKKLLSDNKMKMSMEVRKGLLDSFDDLHRAEVALNMGRKNSDETKHT